MLTWEELQEFQNDWLHVSSEAITRRERWLRRALTPHKIAYMQAVQALRDGRERLVRGFADPLFDTFELDSSISTTADLGRLLELAAQSNADGAPDPRRWFEGLSRFDQAISLAQIEMMDSREALDRDLHELLKFLYDNFFVPGFIDQEVYCYHDPEKNFVVHDGHVSINKRLSGYTGLRERKHHLAFRQTRTGQSVYLRHRNKDAFETWLKTQRQVRATSPKEEPFEVHDRCGLTFIVHAAFQQKEVARQLIDLLVKDGAIEVESLSKGQGSDPNNPHTTQEYRAMKALVRWRERVYEFQFLVFQDYFTAKRCTTSVNHELYRLRQALDVFFPLLWPKRIYRVDWQNSLIRSQLKQWKIDQLGWRVSLNTSLSHPE